MEREERFDDTQTSITYTEFAYDDGGNRTEVDEDGQVTAYTFNDDDQVVTAGTATYSYDDRGNLETITDGSDVTNYDFDAQNRLESVTLPDTTVVSNDYDHDNRRIGQTVNSTETNYLWDEQSRYGDVVLETDSGGNALASYVLADTRLVSQERSSTSHYFLADGQHSTRALTDASANVTDTYDYTAFGTLYDSWSNTTNSYLYTGQQYDSATELYSLRARYYDPSGGRFLSRDTWPLNMFNPSQVNRYGYAIYNPINFYDPNGHDALAGYGLNTEKSVRVGMVAGGLGGLAFSAFFYWLAKTADCGSLAKEWADKTNPNVYVVQSTLEGMLFGGMAGALISAGPVGQAIIGAYSYVSGFNMVLQSSNMEGDCQDFMRTAGVFMMGTGTLTIFTAAGGTLPKWPGSPPKLQWSTANSSGGSGRMGPGSPAGNGGSWGPNSGTVGGVRVHTGTISDIGTITGIGGATAARDATATMSDTGRTTETPLGGDNGDTEHARRVTKSSEGVQQVANDGDLIFEMSPNERTFVDRLLNRKPNLEVYRTPDGRGMGDFAIVDSSNPNARVGWIAELKTQAGSAHAGYQLRNASQVATELRLDQYRAVTGNTAELIDIMSIGRSGW